MQNFEEQNKLVITKEVMHDIKNVVNSNVYIVS